MSTRLTSSVMIVLYLIHRYFDFVAHLNVWIMCLFIAHTVIEHLITFLLSSSHIAIVKQANSIHFCFCSLTRLFPILCIAYVSVYCIHPTFLPWLLYSLDARALLTQRSDVVCVCDVCWMTLEKKKDLKKDVFYTCRRTHMIRRLFFFFFILYSHSDNVCVCWVETSIAWTTKR